MAKQAAPLFAHERLRGRQGVRRYWPGSALAGAALAAMKWNSVRGTCMRREPRRRCQNEKAMETKVLVEGRQCTRGVQLRKDACQARSEPEVDIDGWWRRQRTRHHATMCSRTALLSVDVRQTCGSGH